MKLWQQPTQRLPVRVRPVRGETLVSYTFRLATANDLDRPTILLRALGEPTVSLFQSMVDNYDVVLNQHALRRLETFTGIPAQRLRMSLPALDRTDAPPAGIPATRPHRCQSLRTPCDGCAARLPDHPNIVVRTLHFPQICPRHRRWIDTDQNQPHQVSLTGAPDIITAHRRYTRLRVSVGDNDWTHQQLRQATSIAMVWATRSHLNSPKLHASWTARAAALGGSHDPRQPSPLLVFPEAVALAEILCDLPWRRHVAMVEHDWDLTDFYRRIGRRLSQPRAFVGAIRYLNNHEPLRTWIATHRHQHAQTRTEFWQRHHRRRSTQTPFPEIRHFK
ncbi:MAG TPA: TniQ family protein [Pseudonocardiaceae bacterium]|jgi:hypothetical protein|nr:TniQ family protein [Pseudonocardiaceae bacterium]